jgi:hypothetical protein
LHETGILETYPLDASCCSDDNVRALVRVLEQVTVDFDRQAAEKVADTHILHVRGEAFVLVTDLEGQLAGVAHHQDGYLTVHGFQLLQG